MSTSQSSSDDASTESVRTFLYVDNDFVDSLCAQLLERPDNSPEDASDNTAAGAGQQDRPPSGPAANPRRYNQLEAALGKALSPPSPLHHDTVRSQLEPGHFVHVSGTALLEDYDMLGAICEQWLEIADALIAAHVFQEYGFSGERELQRLRQEIKKLLSKTDDESRTKTLKSQLRSLPSDFDDVFDQTAKNMGMHEQKEWIEQHLGLFNDLFHGNSSSVSLTREEDEGVAFNAPLDDAHLRTEKGRLRLLYNGSRLGTWTLVGQVTALPNRYEDPGIEEIEAGGGSEHMRDNFRGMIGPIQEIYDSIYESEAVAEVVLRPVAIYRETTLTETLTDTPTDTPE